MEKRSKRHLFCVHFMVGIQELLQNKQLQRMAEAKQTQDVHSTML